jgi:hypothetical protein
MKHGGFKHSPDAAFAVPERMNPLEIVTDQRYANQGRYFGG